MFRPAYFIALSLLWSPVTGFAGGTPDVHSPAFTAVPELTAGFDLLYEQKFAEAREAFLSWESRNPEDPFGEVAVAASYLFWELWAISAKPWLKPVNWPENARKPTRRTARLSLP